LKDFETRLSPIEALLSRDISQKDVEGFVNGCEGVLEGIINLDPSVLFTSARGGSVIVWAAEELARIQGYPFPPVHTLLVGNRQGIVDTNLYSPSKKERAKAIKMHPIFSSGELGRYVYNPALIDEKAGGRSSRYTATKVHALLQAVVPLYEGKFHVIALEYKEPRVDLYASMLSSSRGEIIPTVIKAPNPFVDKKEFLDVILAPSGCSGQLKENQEEMLMHVHNFDAKRLIQFLVLSVKKPHTLRAVLDTIDGYYVPFSLEGIDQQAFDDLYYYLLSPSHKQERKTPYDPFLRAFLSWLRSLTESS
jgi:hypothetical protein